jgi:hypothetical protein
MKKQYYLPLFFVLLSLGVSQCGMRHVYINAMRPAEITFPSYVNTFLLLDRTKFEKKAKNTIEGLLTGELPGEDKAGLEEAMNSFQTTLRQSPRFQMVRATESLNGNSLTGAFPDALAWGQIEELCKKYNTDAVVAIEIFDTDFIVTSGKRRVKKTLSEKDEKGVQKVIEVDEYFAEGIGNAQIGFRLYDPRAKTVADQQLFKHSKRWEAVGTSIADALVKLVQKSEATKYVGRQAGADYAFKISPMPVTLAREFYSKPKRAPQLTAGSRRGDVNDWRGAAESWKRGYNVSPEKDKFKGRLAYNISVAYEVLGDLDSANIWASRSYVDHKNKKARMYTYTLEYRKREIEKLNEQMK